MIPRAGRQRRLNNTSRTRRLARALEDIRYNVRGMIPASKEPIEQITLYVVGVFRGLRYQELKAVPPEQSRNIPAPTRNVHDIVSISGGCCSVCVLSVIICGCCCRRSLMSSLPICYRIGV